MMKNTHCQPTLVILIAAACMASSAHAADLSAVVSASGVKGGLIVHLDCGEAKDTSSLRLNDRYLVQGLECDPMKVQAARKTLQAAGVYGPVSVYQYDGTKLPYADNSVNLIVGDYTRVRSAEIMRVLAPLGVAVIDGKTSRKPRPDDIDDWTHYLHGPDGNAVAQDTVVAAPRSLQWVSYPRRGRSHEELPSMSTTVTANGRVFFIVDEAPRASIRYRGTWRLVARDAFNGILLWKKPIPVWIDHLRHFRTGPAFLPRTLVAVGDAVYVTLGLGAPVSALDAATGRELRVYTGTEFTEEILCDDGVLYLAVGTSEVDRVGGGLHMRDEPKPSGFRRVMAVNASSGKILWRNELKEALLPLSLAVRAGRVCYQTATAVVCVDASSGKKRWQTPRTTPERRMAFSGPTVVMADDVVLVADRIPDTKQSASTGHLKWGIHGFHNVGGFNYRSKSRIAAYDLSSGKELWSAPCTETYDSPVDVFVRGDTVWVGADFKPYDVKTGQPRTPLKWAGGRVGMGHHRCYRNKATTRYLLTGRSGIEMVDFEKGWLNNNSWIRGTCGYGIMPANGLLYAPPDACACFMRVKMNGYLAVGPRRGDGTMRFPAAPVIERGPAHGTSAAATLDGDWPMYRRDPSRSGSAPRAVDGNLSKQWNSQLSGRLTQPVIANGTVVVAEVDAHTVHALDARTGARRWSYTAGGRVDTAPTVYKGLVLFGSADGWVYALRLSDGALSWRFRAAPEERLVYSYGQLESTWPVHGAVLVQNNVLFVNAGRATYLDGGIVLYRLDPITGAKLSRTVMYDIDPKTTRQTTYEGNFDMEGSRNDVLVGDGESVYIKHLRFDAKGKKAPIDKPHLLAIGGFTEDEWMIRTYWLIGTASGAGFFAWANAAKKAPFGRILNITDNAVYGYGRVRIAGGKTGHKLDAYHLFCSPKIMQFTGYGGGKPPRGKRRPREKKQEKPKPVWSDTKAPIVRAMVVAGDTLVVAGPPDLGKKVDKGGLRFENPAEAIAGFRGEKGVLLQGRSIKDGRKIQEAKLSAMPVFDGMSSAGGRVYIALESGVLECWE